MPKFKPFCVLSVFLVFALLFASCESSPKTAENFEVQRMFSSHMNAKVNEKTFSADIVCNSYEDISISFTEPEELKGFTVKTKGDSYSIDAYGIEDCLDYNDINEASFLNILVKTIKTSVYTNHGLFTRDRKTDSYKAELNINNVPVNTVFNKEGLMTSLTASQLGFYAEFTYANNS